MMAKTDLVYVLLTEGKHESVDFATVVVFSKSVDALKFCRANNTGITKYWRKAEIVQNNERVDLLPPDHGE